MRAVVLNPHAWVGNRGGQGTARPTADFFAQADRFVIAPASVARADGYIPIDEGCLDPY